MASTISADTPKGVQSNPLSEGDSNDVGETEVLSPGSQKLHRKLRGREVQLFAVGGAIGTSLFVQMGAALPKGGPAGLFIGFIAYGTIVLAVNECFAEMVCYMPIPSPFVRLAGHWVDDALSFAMGWNFFLAMALNIPYEMVAINVLLTYWTDKVPAAVVVVIVMAIYGILNVLTVRYFGIAEFYLSFFKIFLMIGLILYTFITMVGGNPHHDPIGFRYWNDPGAFVSHLVPGDTGRFLGVLSCMIQGAFTMVGPEFISMAAGEAERPRRVMRKAFASFGWRLMFFFCLGALCVGIVIPYNDPTLAAMLDGTKQGSGTGAASPYVISMNHFGIQVLPDIVNVLIMTSVLSAGNNVVFSASRTLYGMSLEKKAPKWVSKTNRAGLPYNAVAIAMAFSLLGFLQVSNSSATVLNWLVSCIAGSYLLNYFGTCITYLHFHASLRRQGISRETLPYQGRLQPYTAWYALGGTGVMVLVLGYNVFLSGGWDLKTFFLTYVMIGFYALTFVFWKIFRRTRYVGIGKADLQLRGVKREIDEYEEVEYARRRGKPVGFLDRLFE
ncbi:amino acid permease/ SLC12A domain-containing protein [Aspergillus bertholletiae]|uniref:Amino acid permease/ SLC12A domain-containing protein n=1 Tax=Aspergillus bertholletiae TaxID=1226010 RepID=A0A5N7B161_9EURO|nr:amino acid permease/ SLC12A domain-containing protein [Aspergillus bertholletiae]